MEEGALGREAVRRAGDPSRESSHRSDRMDAQIITEEAFGRYQIRRAEWETDYWSYRMRSGDSSWENNYRSNQRDVGFMTEEDLRRYQTMRTDWEQFYWRYHTRRDEWDRIYQRHQMRTAGELYRETNRRPSVAVVDFPSHMDVIAMAREVIRRYQMRRAEWEEFYWSNCNQDNGEVVIEEALTYYQESRAEWEEGYWSYQMRKFEASARQNSRRPNTTSTTHSSADLEARRDDMMGRTEVPPPPPYSAGRASPNPPPTAAAHDPLLQFRRWMIDLMAFTFDADFAKLNQALGQSAYSTASPTTILTADEHDRLLALAVLIKELAPKALSDSQPWLTVSSSDLETIADAIIRPALFLGLKPSYILVLTRTYAAHRCDASKRSLSYISQCKDPFYRVWRSLAWLGHLNSPIWLLTNDLWSHACIIESVTSKGDERIILGESMDRYQRDVLGLSSIGCHYDGFLCGPYLVRLQRACVSDDEENMIEGARRSRERKEATDNAEKTSERYNI
ncbi:hypothetical protein BCR34DRAFT_589966 [Clohesyomyces aquaticus]|uniref:Uncharacterized protein n=1 Tax=Clohesyomyces aquaticus TaxID=1231657 RepID=A0A1Y1ZDV6_9PLEO|nr:hypothetical protein BCR34DRAFT_589966 [Clohesyomyces aquaticus]